MNKKLPTDLTKAELQKAVSDIVAFYDFTFFGERSISESDGLTFALEMQACSLGLVGDWLYEDGYDSAEMMQDFVKAMNDTAGEMSCSHWPEIREHLPYMEKSK